jgi:paraquat-inducible protein B
MDLSSDSERILIFARLRSKASHLAVEGSSFSVVQPELGLQGIRGLDTLLSGSYINIEKGEGKPTTQFEGSTRSSNEREIETGVTYFLRANFGDSIQVGNPILFRGIKVGTVTSLSLDSRGRGVDVEISVQKEYVTLIRTNSVFWQKAAVSADLGLFRAQIEISSMQSLMQGGIVFATPNDAGKIANAESHFNLQENPPENWKTWAPEL